jgi:hypothetical protein
MGLTDIYGKYPKAWIIEDHKLVQGWVVGGEFIHLGLDEDGKEDVFAAPGKEVFHARSDAFKVQITGLEEAITSMKKALTKAKHDLYNDLHQELHGDNAPGF